jgi:hypothetical protein
MGNLQSTKIFYHNLTTIDKQTIIQRLISEYSDIEISSMDIRRERQQITTKIDCDSDSDSNIEISSTDTKMKWYESKTIINYLIHLDKYDIYFCGKKELIDCLLKLKRPFIMSENYEYITIQFVYTNH